MDTNNIREFKSFVETLIGHKKKRQKRYEKVKEEDEYEERITALWRRGHSLIAWGLQIGQTQGYWTTFAKERDPKKKTTKIWTYVQIMTTWYSLYLTVQCYHK